MNEKLTGSSLVSVTVEVTIPDTIERKPGVVAQYNPALSPRQPYHVRFDDGTSGWCAEDEFSVRAGLTSNPYILLGTLTDPNEGKAVATPILR